MNKKENKGIISEELLGDVLGVVVRMPTCIYSYYTERTRTHHKVDKERDVVYYPLCEKGHRKGTTSINIYELVHKCKEKAYKKGFIILSGYNENNINAFQVKCFGWTSDKIHIKFNLEAEDTEPTAIFKAYQWILNKEKTEQC